jgi:hypothetical protein
VTLNLIRELDDCFYSDGLGNVYFCVSNFLRANDLPNDPDLRIAVIEELLDMFPDVRVLDERDRPSG